MISAHAVAKPIPPELMQAPQQERPTILLVTGRHTDASRLQLCTTLRLAGYDLRLPAPHRMLLTIHESQNPPGLILLDTELNQLDPFQLCVELKNEPSTQSVPLVMLVSGTSEMVRALEAGADDFLIHPAQSTHLLARIRALLQLKATHDEMAGSLRRLTEIGIALSKVRDLDHLLERIVDEARAINNADAATLYTVDHENQELHIEIIQNDTLGIQTGGTRGTPILRTGVPLIPSNVSAHVALTGETINIADVYQADGFDFSGPQRYDAMTGYRSTSMLVVPMRNYDGEIIGVLQLINAQDPQSGRVVAFRESNVERTEALASQAGIALTNARLIHGMEALLQGLIEVMAVAVDEKSPSTFGHVQRVTRLAIHLARSVNNHPAPLDGYRFTPDQLQSVRIAAQLHDIGKIVVPEHLVEKATKLQCVYDRIEHVRTRFKLIQTFLENEALHRKLALFQGGSASPEALSAIDAELAIGLGALDDDLAFIERCNRGSERMEAAHIARLEEIASHHYCDASGTAQPYLTADEVRNLSIVRGTLLPEEVQVIRNHATVSINLLEQIPFPTRLRDVPIYAGDHHEMLDGSGYPKGKQASELPLGSRVLAIADIFDALTASDRHYKEPYSVERAYGILREEARLGHLDPWLVDLFIQSNAYQAVQL